MTTGHSATDVRIFHKECKSLAAAGFDVTLGAGAEHDFEEAGVLVKAFPRSPGRRGRVGTAFRVAGFALRQRAGIFHLHDPELLPLGFLLKLRRKTVIYDAHEDAPRQLLTRTWIPRLLRRPAAGWVALLEALAGRAFDAIVVATPAIERRFPPRKTVRVANFPVHDGAGPVTTPSGDRSNVLTYVGVLTRLRGAHEMVAALELIPEHLGARLTIAGSFADRGLEDELRALPGWKSVDFLGWSSRDGVAHLLDGSVAGLVLFHPAPNHMESYPTKLFEYMAAGLPVVASDLPAWRDLIEEESCGVLVDPLDPESIAAGIEALLNDPEAAAAMGARGRRAVETKYNWTSEGAKLVDLYRKLAAGA